MIFTVKGSFGGIFGTHKYLGTHEQLSFFVRQTAVIFKLIMQEGGC